MFTSKRRRLGSTTCSIGTHDQALRLTPPPHEVVHYLTRRGSASDRRPNCSPRTRREGLRPILPSCRSWCARRKDKRKAAPVVEGGAFVVRRQATSSKSSPGKICDAGTHLPEPMPRILECGRSIT